MIRPERGYRRQFSMRVKHKQACITVLTYLSLSLAGVASFRFRKGSGGRGRMKGGDGIVREYEFLAPAQASIVSDRRKTRPYGEPPGKPGRNTLNGRHLPGKVNFRVKAGDRVRIETPGGGGSK